MAPPASVATPARSSFRLAVFGRRPAIATTTGRTQHSEAPTAASTAPTIVNEFVCVSSIACSPRSMSGVGIPWGGI